MPKKRSIVAEKSSPTSSFQNLSISLCAVGQRKGDDFIVSREFDLCRNPSSASYKNQFSFHFPPHQQK